MRARTPTPGLRQRLRVALKQHGFTKFQTDERRSVVHGVFLLVTSSMDTEPFDTFDGVPVKYSKR